MAEESVDTAGGVVIEGSVTLPAAGQPASDWPGLYIEYAPGLGSYIQVGPAGVTHFGLMAESENQSQREDVMARAWPFRDTVTFRTLLKESVLEFYLDDLLIQSYSLPAEATGRIGILNPTGAILDIQVWNAA